MTTDEAIALAERCGLRHVTDAEPGWQRRRAGRGFTFLDRRGDVLRGRRRRRAEQLVIPPAWRDVWICPDPRGHIRATGRDADGRKQYVYHPEWERARDQVKFDAMADFGSSLRELRSAVDRDLGRSGLSRERVLALVVMIMDETLIRVGSATYAETNGTYGLTTLRREHTTIGAGRTVFEFAAKHGKDRSVTVDDRRLSKIVADVAELGNEELFAYLDSDGAVVDVTADDVNTYLRDRTGLDVTSKDFRTWGGTTAAACHLRDRSPDPSTYLEAVDATAERLGNTRAVARSSYIHPVVEEAFSDGSLARAWQRSRGGRGLQRCERTVLKLLD